MWWGQWRRASGAERAGTPHPEQRVEPLILSLVVPRPPNEDCRTHLYSFPVAATEATPSQVT